MENEASKIKTIILCGGTGTRLKEETEFKPKPMVEIGGKPILWHIMKIYSHYGYNDFVLALGYKGNCIRDYFLRQKCYDCDFSFNSGENKIKNFYQNGQEENFNITFAETGQETPTGERTLKSQKYINGDIFMVTYGDGISDININKLVEFHKSHGKIATITGVHPVSRWGFVNSDSNNIVTEFAQKPMLYDYANGGFMVFNKEFFNFIKEGDMIEDTLSKLVEQKQLAIYKHEGFWYGMDTYRDFLYLNSVWEKGPKWKVWADKAGKNDTDEIISEDVKQIASKLKNELSALEGKTLLVSGGAGFICSYFSDVVAYLNDNYFSNPCKIICLDNLANSNKNRLKYLAQKPYFIFLNQSVLDPVSYEGNVDFIVHGASLASPTLYRQYPLETIEANTMGTKNMLKLAVDKKVKSFIYLSSSEIYGNPLPENIPTPETYLGNVSCTGPRACYDESKRLGETLCMVFFNKHNVPVKIVRPFNVYGPGMTQDKRVICDFIANALNNEPITMYSTGKDTRTFCYIADAITGMFKILLSGHNGQVFNVGSDSEETSVMELAQTINAIFDNKLQIVQKISEDPNYLKDNPQRRCPDLTKIKTLLNYKPETGLKAGLIKTINWQKKYAK